MCDLKIDVMVLNSMYSVEGPICIILAYSIVKVVTKGSIMDSHFLFWILLAARTSD